MAIEKTVTINVDGKRAVKSLEELGGTFEDVYGEMQPLNTQIGELEDRLYEMSLRGEQGTKEFKDLTSQVGKMRKTIIDTDLAIDGMSQNMAQASTGAVMGIASGFELAQGSMAAFGVEGEQVEATLLKVQSAMAISQGLQGIREAIPSFKNLAAQVSMFGGNIMKSVKALGAFQKAMIATGIGALIAGIGLLVANWDKLRAAIFGASKAQEANNAVTATAIENASEELSALDKLKKTVNDETVSRKQKNDAIKQLQEDYPDLLTNIDAEKDSLDKVNIAIEENSRLVMLQAKLKATQELRTKAYKDMLEEEAEAMQGNNVGLMEYMQAVIFNTNAVAEGNQQTKENLKQNKEQIAIYDEMGTSFEKQIALIKQETESKKENNKEEEKKVTTVRKTAQKVIEEKREELSQINSLKQIELDFHKKVEDEKIDYTSKGFAVIAQMQQEELERNRLAREKEREEERQLRDAKVTLASEALGATSNLVQSFAGENEKAQERAFKITKAINIAQAVMDTYKGANAIFASAAANPSTILFPAQPFIAAGAAVAAGLANVASIAKQKFQGGANSAPSGGGGATAPSLGGGAGSNPATFNVVGNTGNNQLAQTLGSGTMKAYVVSGDVSSAQELERNKIQQSTL